MGLLPTHLVVLCEETTDVRHTTSMGPNECSHDACGGQAPLEAFHTDLNFHSAQ